MALKDNLVSVWCENATITEDLHGSNDLTNNNSTGSASGKVGTAGDFESGSSQYLSITDASQTGLDITGDMSMAAWVQFESLPGVAGRIMTKWDDDGERSYSWWWNNAATDLIRLELQNSSGGESLSDVAWATPSTATWYHIAVSYAASAGEVIHYLNGVQTGATQTGAVTNIRNGNATFMIGWNQDGSAFYWDGLINQAAIWGRTITSTDVSQIYNSGNGLAYSSWDAVTGPTNLKSLDTNLKANIKSYNTNPLANIKSINGNV